MKRSFCNKAVTGKTPFFAICPHCTYFTWFVLTLAFERAVLHGNAALLILVLSTRNGTSVFLKRFLLFRKFCFEMQVLRKFQIFINCHIKTSQSLKLRAILNLLALPFRGT